MSKLLKIQESDESKILYLKEKSGAKSKTEVLRAALILLEKEILKKERLSRLRAAAEVVGSSSMSVFKDFNNSKRFEDI